MLKITDLTVKVENNIILNDFSMELPEKQLHVIMGPNGSGKSSLAYTIMGHPNYIIENGVIELNKLNILNLSIEKRAQLKIFLAFQSPVEIPGVQIFNFLRAAYQSLNSPISTTEFRDLINKYTDILELDNSVVYRNLNEGFSGGQKKKLEILQMLVLKPKLLILDEIDSGLDIDSLKVVSNAINLYRSENPQLSIILITHNTRILKYLIPDTVHILISGKLIRSGSLDLAKEIENKGYDNIQI